MISCFLVDFSEKKMDQPSGRSFMQVLCEKYSPENFPYRRGPGMGVHVPATPQGSPMKGKEGGTKNMFLSAIIWVRLQHRLIFECLVYFEL